MITTRSTAPTRHVKPALDELQELSHRSTRLFVLAMNRLARAKFLEDPGEHEAALKGLATLLAETMTLADLYGRRRLLLEVEAVAGRQPKNLPPHLFKSTPIVPEVPFLEAVHDLITRHPELIDPTLDVPRWRQVADMYHTRHAFAMALSADMRITERVQKAMAKGLMAGRGRGAIEEAIEAIGDFTRAYADTVYRTNLNTAFTAGRFAQAQTEAVAHVVGGFEYVAIRDSDARHNHLAAHGLIASQFDRIWEKVAPPNGYNCRCGLRMVDRFELRQKGLIKGTEVLRRIPQTFRDFYPNKGFERKRIEWIAA
jgi:SPP1 gp7 family putative phage head morphogenesis protein